MEPQACLPRVQGYPLQQAGPAPQAPACTREEPAGDSRARECHMVDGLRYRRATEQPEVPRAQRHQWLRPCSRRTESCAVNAGKLRHPLSGGNHMGERQAGQYPGHFATLRMCMHPVLEEA